MASTRPTGSQARTSADILSQLQLTRSAAEGTRAAAQRIVSDHEKDVSLLSVIKVDLPMQLRVASMIFIPLSGGFHAAWAPSAHRQYPTMAIDQTTDLRTFISSAGIHPRFVDKVSHTLLLQTWSTCSA